MQEDEEQEEEEGEAEDDPGDCCEAAAVIHCPAGVFVTSATVCDTFCPLLRSEFGESVKEAALMLFRMLHPPPLPFVIMWPVELVLLLLLVQVDMQVPGGRAECKSDVLLLFVVEAVLRSWL